MLELESEQSVNTQKYTALDNWAKNLGATHQAILSKMCLAVYVTVRTVIFCQQWHPQRLQLSPSADHVRVDGGFKTLKY